MSRPPERRNAIRDTGNGAGAILGTGQYGWPSRQDAETGAPPKEADPIRAERTGSRESIGARVMIPSPENSTTRRQIVCDGCHKRRTHYALELCATCYSRLKYQREMARHHAAMDELVTVRADGLLTSDYYRRWQASRRTGLPSRVYRVQTDDAGLVRVARRVS